MGTRGRSAGGLLVRVETKDGIPLKRYAVPKEIDGVKHYFIGSEDITPRLNTVTRVVAAPWNNGHDTEANPIPPAVMGATSHPPAGFSSDSKEPGADEEDPYLAALNERVRQLEEVNMHLGDLKEVMKGVQTQIYKLNQRLDALGAFTRDAAAIAERERAAKMQPRRWEKQRMPRPS